VFVWIFLRLSISGFCAGEMKTSKSNASNNKILGGMIFILITKTKKFINQ